VLVLGFDVFGGKLAGIPVDLMAIIIHPFKLFLEVFLVVQCDCSMMECIG